jgi:hypothetical protein
MAANVAVIGCVELLALRRCEAELPVAFAFVASSPT